MSVRSTITSQFQQVAIEQERTLAVVGWAEAGVQSGLDSLSFAIIVARLQDSLGIDPFSASVAIEFPVTFGDFVRLYENFAKRRALAVGIDQRHGLPVRAPARHPRRN